VLAKVPDVEPEPHDRPLKAKPGAARIVPRHFGLPNEGTQATAAMRTKLKRQSKRVLTASVPGAPHQRPQYALPAVRRAGVLA